MRLKKLMIIIKSSSRIVVKIKVLTLFSRLNSKFSTKLNSILRIYLFLLYLSSRKSQNFDSNFNLQYCTALQVLLYVTETECSIIWNFSTLYVLFRNVSNWNAMWVWVWEWDFSFLGKCFEMQQNVNSIITLS